MALRMQCAPQGHTDTCRYRIVGMLKRRPESKRRLERVEESRDATFARYMEQQEKHVWDDVSGASLGSSGQTVAPGGGPPAYRSGQEEQGWHRTLR